ncbi:MAG: LCP family protein [Bacillota bacterium]|nr:LCP family protein [Bacillota bacterium]
MENNTDAKKIHLAPASAGYAVIMIIAFLAEAAFILMMMTLDVLPAKYTVCILLGMAVLDFVMLILMGNRNKLAVRIAGVALAAVLIAVMCMGAYYMYNTYKTLQKIAEYNSHFEQYDVLVLKDGSYDKASSIKGQQVYAFENDSKMYHEAQEKLITKSAVEFEMVEDSNAAISKLIDASGKTGDNIVYISDNNYQMLCDEDEKYADEIKVLTQIKVIKRDKDNAARVDVTQDPFNICVTGIDMWGSIDQVSRSDVNMIVTVNPQTRTILLSSVPRDSYVVLHSFGEYDKLTHTGVWGVDETTSTIEDWLDIDINYYVRVNFSMLVDIVNAIDGIDVYSDYEFKSAIADYEYKKGWNHLNGREALYFARERHAFEDEDQQRIIDQQKVMKACLKKVMGSKTLLTSYTDLLKAVDDEMETNMSEKEMASIVKMQLNDMSKWKIKMQSVKGDLTMKGTYTMGMGRDLLVSIPRQDSVDKVSKNIHDTLYPEDID